MLIKVPQTLPARQILQSENIPLVDTPWNLPRGTRPLQIAILNLMPNKIETETNLLRVLGSSPLPVEVTWVRVNSHRSKNTSQEHLASFYQTFDQIKFRHFDGLMITGTPVEHLEFEQVDYWPELKRIMDWGLRNVPSLFYICWGAQAALHHHYGISKYALPEKKFGVFAHETNDKNVDLLRGFDDVFFAPHARFTEIRREDIEKIPALQIVSESADAGVNIVVSRDGRQVFVTGHPEYDSLALKKEYERDTALNLPIPVPVNYYPQDDPTRQPLVRWRSHAHLLYSNWLHYYVSRNAANEANTLQRTPMMSCQAIHELAVPCASSTYSG